MPASLTYPGVYIEELPSNVHTIAGVATSIAAFIGWAPQGPINQAVMVQSFPQFQAIFGGFKTGVYLAYAVNQFFANGGTQAYIVRLTWDGTQTPAPGSNPAVSTTALAAGIGFPSAQITASAEGVVSPPITIDIGAPVQQGLQITPANPPTLPLGAEVTFSASALFADGSTGTPTSPVSWSSNGPAITITSAGVATANAVGTAVITAKSGYATASLALTVSGLTATGISISPSNFSLAAGQQQQLNAIATLADGSTLDVTSLVAWVAPAKVTITPSGLAVPTGTTAASETVAANFVTTANTYNATATVALGAALAASLAVYPAGAAVNVGQTVDYAVRATYSDGTAVAPPTSGTPSWSSSNTAVATVIATTGVVTPVSAGASVISVTLGALTASATLTVTAATLKSLSVTPLNTSVASGQSAQLAATAIYSDGSSVDLTDSVTWTPSTPMPTPTPLTHNTVDEFTGLVTTALVGATNTMTATVPWQNTVKATANIAVTAPVVKSIAVTPPSSPLTSGQSAALTAVATMSDGSRAAGLAGFQLGVVGAVDHQRRCDDRRRHRQCGGRFAGACRQFSGRLGQQPAGQRARFGLQPGAFRPLGAAAECERSDFGARKLRQPFDAHDRSAICADRRQQRLQLHHFRHAADRDALADRDFDRVLRRRRRRDPDAGVRRQFRDCAAKSQCRL